MPHPESSVQSSLNPEENVKAVWGEYPDTKSLSISIMKIISNSCVWKHYARCGMAVKLTPSFSVEWRDLQRFIKVDGGSWGDGWVKRRASCRSPRAWVQIPGSLGKRPCRATHAVTSAVRGENRWNPGACWGASLTKMAGFRCSDCLSWCSDCTRGITESID